MMAVSNIDRSVHKETTDICQSFRIGDLPDGMGIRIMIIDPEERFRLPNFFQCLNYLLLPVRINGKNLYEYGNAVAHVTYIDDATYQKLVETLPYVKIFRHKECNFSIIKY